MLRRLKALPWHRLAPLGLVLIAVGFNLWVLRGELMGVANLNDSSVHESLLRWAHEHLRAGRVPLDGWYPYRGLGASFVTQIETLPYLIGAAFASVFGDHRTFVWSLYLLLALWPISVYAGARLMGWGAWTAGAAALVSPLLASSPGHGFEYGSYVWRGYGVWAQLWAMWLLPLALGFSWRAIARGGSLTLAVLAVSLTLACHVREGYLALLLIAVWVVLRPSELRRRGWRAAGVLGGSLLVSPWILVPGLLTSRGLLGEGGGSDLPGYFRDSFGAGKVLRWFVTGALYDDGRGWPAVTILVGIGLIVCVARWRRDERARAALAVWAISMLLFFGRPTLGPLLDVLPGNRSLLLHRFIMGVHMGGILVAGVGASWLGNAAIRAWRRRAPGVSALVPAAAVVIVGAIFLAPALHERVRYNDVGRSWMREQQVDDRTDGADLAALFDVIKSRGGGRAYAGSYRNWGREYRVGDVPVFTEFLNNDVPSLGFDLRGQPVPGDFNDARLGDYELFDVRYLVLPSDRRPPVPATFVAGRGRHRLWQVNTSGYFDVVDSFPSPAGLVPGNDAGQVEKESYSEADDLFRAEVVADRPALVVLNANDAPYWQVTVDGVKVRRQRVAGGLVGRVVPAGRHSVAFRYRGYPHYGWLFALGALTLVALAVFDRLLRARGEPKNDLATDDYTRVLQPGARSSMD